MSRMRIQLKGKKNLLVEAIWQTQFGDLSITTKESCCPTWRILHGMAYNGLPAVRYYAYLFLHAGLFPWISARSAPTVLKEFVHCIFRTQGERLGTSHLPFMTGLVEKGTRESVQKERFFRSWVTFFKAWLKWSQWGNCTTVVEFLFFLFWLSFFFFDQGGSKKCSIRPLNAKRDGNTWNHTFAHSKEQPVMRFSSLSILQRSVKIPPVLSKQPERIHPLLQDQVSVL